MVGIGDKVKLKAVLRSEFLMRLLVIDRNAEQLNVLFIKFVVRIPERARFLGSARGVVFWVKEQHDALAFQVRELDRVAVVVSGRKVRCLIAFFEHKRLK